MHLCAKMHTLSRILRDSAGLNMVYPFQRGDRFYTSESDVCGRQILTHKDGPHTARIKQILMAVYP